MGYYTVNPFCLRELLLRFGLQKRAFVHELSYTRQIFFAPMLANFALLRIAQRLNRLSLAQKNMYISTVITIGDGSMRRPAALAYRAPPPK